jgi:hypothetical protein
VLAPYREEELDENIKETFDLKVIQFTGIMGNELETKEDQVLVQTVATEHMHHIVERLKTSKKRKENKAV